MADPNVNRPEWDVESSEPPFRRRAMRLGSRAGAAEIGVTLYEIDAGGAVSPYHAHHANEELLLVLDGQPQLRTPDGSRRLQPGDTVAFPRGPLGAHRISNPGGPPARVLVFSTMNLPEVAEYPDTGTLLTKTGLAALLCSLGRFVEAEGTVDGGGGGARGVQASVAAARFGTMFRHTRDSTPESGRIVRPPSGGENGSCSGGEQRPALTFVDPRGRGCG